MIKKYLSILTALSISVPYVLSLHTYAEIDGISSNHEKISIELSEIIETNSDEEIPVIVWLNEEDDTYIEQVIKDRIGYDINSLEEQYSAPSDKLIEELNTATDGEKIDSLDILMKKHMEITEESRTIEKEKTDKYLHTRREVISEVTDNKMNSFMEKYDFLSDKTFFVSSHSPMMLCKLSSEEIFALSENETVESIMQYVPLEITECSINLGSTPNTVGINAINEALNLNGQGIKIGIYETSCVSQQFAPDFGLSPSEITYVGNYYSNGTDHSTYCAGIAAGNDGVAPGAVIYSSTCEYDWINFDWTNYDNSSLSYLEDLIEHNVDIISISWGSTSDVSCYNYWTKYMDSLIYNNRITIVCATGNDGNGYIISPATSYNCIAVNGFIDNYNGQTQNVLNDYSYKNGNGCYKPDVTAPSLNNGTSIATPYVAGMIALMYQYKPSLSAAPEVTKAILMGSCHKKCNKLLSGNTLSNLQEQMGLSNRQGAGIPNIYTMISIVAQHTYGRGVLNSNNNFERTINFVQPSYNSQHINVSMAFLKKDTPSNVLDNCDISLRNNNTTSYSQQSNSSTEVIYRALTSDKKYTLRIYNTNTTNTINYGYAWSVNNTKFYPTNNKTGIYYIKNSKSGKYLTSISNSSNVSVNSFTGATNQYWIIYNNTALNDRLVSATGTEKSIEKGNVINGNYFSAIKSNSPSNLTLVSLGDDKYSFEKFESTNGYRLGVYSNSVSSGVAASWYNKNLTNESQQWYLEPVGYNVGDANMDGVINSADATFIMNYYASSGTVLNNITKYLSDFNRDGIVDAVDASLILSYIS